MTAVLLELGFMDSRTDAPVILTEEFAEQAARGIVEALVQVYQLEEKEMTREEIRAIVREELERVEAERAAMDASDWAKPILEQAKSRGITDGTRPQSFATRQEVALMVRSAICDH